VCGAIIGGVAALSLNRGKGTVEGKEDPSLFPLCAEFYHRFGTEIETSHFCRDIAGTDFTKPEEVKARREAARARHPDVGEDRRRFPGPGCNRKRKRDVCRDGRRICPTEFVAPSCAWLEGIITRISVLGPCLIAIRLAFAR
jgi:hypothetical protein